MNPQDFIITRELNRSNSLDQSPLFSGLFSGVSTKYSIDFSFYPAGNFYGDWNSLVAVSNTIKTDIQAAFQSNGISISFLTVNVKPDGSGFNVTGNFTYPDNNIDVPTSVSNIINSMGYYPSAATNGQYLVLDIEVTQISSTVTPTPKPNPVTQTPIPSTPIPAATATSVLGDYLKNADGSYFKDVNNKCVREDSGSLLGLSSVDCPAGASSGGDITKQATDFLGQIGSYFGFDKPTSTLGGLGITAAAGGVVVILAVLLLTKD